MEAGAVPDVTAILRALAACPTAPFYEAYVARQITQFCRDFGLNVRADEFGNLFVTLPGSASKGTAAGRPIAFCAHMDHPGLEVVSDAPLRVRVRGGLRWPDHPVALRFVTTEGEVRGRAVMKQEAEGVTDLLCEAEAPVPTGAFAVLDVDDFREDGDLLHGRAMDDLAGCAAILAALARCRAEGMGDGTDRITGVFTRAEEVGLVGATLVCEARSLPSDAVVVSLETSRQLPGGEMGAGPVIRVGDRSTVFDPAGESLLRRAADRLLAARPETLIQRQLMAGGTCEATIFQLAGYCATGVALPLGNYHNVAPNGGLEAEFIHRRDLETCVDLLVAAAREAAQPAGPNPLLGRLRARALSFAGRLREKAGQAER